MADGRVGLIGQKEQGSVRSEAPGEAVGAAGDDLSSGTVELFFCAFGACTWGDKGLDEATRLLPCGPVESVGWK